MTASGGEPGRLTVATVGAGYFSALHVEAWLRNPLVRFAGLADLDEAKARKLLDDQDADAGDVPTFASAGEMFDAVRPDIIDIATPPSAHREIIEAALGTDARLIVCQKPFCGSLVEAEAAVASIEAAGRKVAVHENFRFQPWYRTIRREIDSGRVGDLYQISFRLRPGDGQGESAYLDRQPYFQTMPRLLIHETAVHWIDTFRFLMGEPQSVWADLRRLNPVICGEDAGMFLYRYDDGRRALFDGNRLADHPADNPRLTMGECLVEGSAAVIRLDGFGALSIRRKGSQHSEPIALDFPAERFGGDCVYALQKHLADHLVSGTPLENEAAQYLENLRIEEAIYRAAESGCVVDVAAQASARK